MHKAQIALKYNLEFTVQRNRNIIHINIMSYDILNIFDNKHYSNLAKSNSKNYIDAKPYPHIVFDNFLPDNIVKIISFRPVN